MKSHVLRRTSVGIAVTAVGALALAGCSGSDGGSGGSSGSTDEEITLTITTFGTFGYEDLYEEYMDEHENITIEATATSVIGDVTKSINLKGRQSPV